MVLFNRTVSGRLDGFFLVIPQAPQTTSQPGIDGFGKGAARGSGRRVLLQAHDLVVVNIQPAFAHQVLADDVAKAGA